LRRRLDWPRGELRPVRSRQVQDGVGELPLRRLLGGQVLGCDRIQHLFYLSELLCGDVLGDARQFCLLSVSFI